MIGYEYFIERMKIKKLDKITIILIILFIINIIVLIIAIREMVNGCDSCKMYDASNETSWGVRGLYWHEDKYYCIWAEGRSLSEQRCMNTAIT